VRTALVVAVPEAEPLVGRARSRYDLADKTGIPAHITILFPFGDREDGLDELFARFPPFDFALASVRRWPTVLWLAPEPSEPFVALTNAVADRYPEHPPYGGEHDEVIPHLTVGHREEVPLELDAELRRGLPIAARAMSVVQLEEFAHHRWRERRRFALGARQRPQSAGSA
jgi:2'-5' RNA ligase